jgi:hypothetical protein
MKYKKRISKEKQKKKAKKSVEKIKEKEKLRVLLLQPVLSYCHPSPSSGVFCFQ